MGQRRRYLFICTNRRADEHPKRCCTARGATEIYTALKAELSARGLATLEVRACKASCLDQCTAGPTILVEPDHFFYGRVAVADVPEIVAGLVSGERVERLVLTADDLALG